jgi:predicted DNA-binding antitoxin AbrB/MazE fold protein
MSETVKAIFEHGVLKPLDYVDLREDELVLVQIHKLNNNEQEAEQEGYASYVAEDGDPDLTWEDIQKVTAKIPGSLAEEFRRERDERF